MFNAINSDVCFFDAGSMVVVWSETPLGAFFLKNEQLGGNLKPSAYATHAFETDKATAVLLLDNADLMGLSLEASDAS